MNLFIRVYYRRCRCCRSLTSAVLPIADTMGRENGDLKKDLKTTYRLVFYSQKLIAIKILPHIVNRMQDPVPRVCLLQKEQ